MKLINDLLRHTEAYKSEIEAAVAQVIKSGWFVLGPETTAFQNEFASYCGAASCVGVGNGTDALELALRTLGIDADDRVACVANAGGYSLHAIRAVGALPAFVDVNATTMNMEPALLERMLQDASTTKPVRAVIFTHLYGSVAGIEAATDICTRYDVPLIEDCAQAHGALVAGKRAGAWGKLGCFSFYPTKNLGALGDGGAVITSDAALASKLLELRQYGWKQTKYISEVSGARNSRLDEIQAAVLRVKLRHLDAWNARRRKIAERYAQGLSQLAIMLPMAAPLDGGYVAHLYVIRTARREELRKYLKTQQIGCDVHYPVPDHQQPICPPGARVTPLPVTEKLATEVLTLPCYPEMTDSEVDTVTAAVGAWARSLS